MLACCSHQGAHVESRCTCSCSASMACFPPHCMCSFLSALPPFTMCTNQPTERLTAQPTPNRRWGAHTACTTAPTCPPQPSQPPAQRCQPHPWRPSTRPLRAASGRSTRRSVRATTTRTAVRSRLVTRRVAAAAPMGPGQGSRLPQPQQWYQRILRVQLQSHPSPRAPPCPPPPRPTTPTPCSWRALAPSWLAGWWGLALPPSSSSTSERAPGALGGGGALLLLLGGRGAWVLLWGVPVHLFELGAWVACLCGQVWYLCVTPCWSALLNSSKYTGCGGGGGSPHHRINRCMPYEYARRVPHARVTHKPHKLTSTRKTSTPTSRPQVGG